MKMVAALLGIFLFIFAILNLTGWLTQETILSYLESAKNAPHWIIVLIAVGLLVIDLVIAVPSAAVTMLCGNLLGWLLGALTATIGMTIAGSIGYALSYRYGTRILEKTYKDPDKRQEVHDTFEKHSTAWLLFSRILPMFPEIASCLAGATRMPFIKYITLYGMSSLLYSLSLSYAGSISNIENPTPVIVIYLVVMAVMWLGWWLSIKRRKNQNL